MNRVYRYRLYPSRSQSFALFRTLWLLRGLYNACIEERSTAWKRQSISVSKKMQDTQLKAIRDADPDYGDVHFHLLQDVVLRADLAFKSFFRRCKSGEKPGYPRFKSRDRYHSFTFKDAAHRNGVRLVSGGKRLYVHGIGNVKIKLHREHEGKLKQIRIIRLGDDHWYADFVCADVAAKPLLATGRGIGIDLGLMTFAALSDGTLIENERRGRHAQERLAELQRELSTKKRGSNRRKKTKAVLAKLHLKVARQRRDDHRKIALRLVKQNDWIAVEDLNVKGLAAGALAKSVHDAGWTQFISILVSKAESAGREVVLVDPRGTSQTCSDCQAHVPKDLSVRVHECPGCGLVLDRDVNAARNVYRLGLSLREARSVAA